MQVTDERAYSLPINTDSSLIVSKGRILKGEIVQLDREIDSADGNRKGRVRWYECRGLSCDEGWEPLLSGIIEQEAKLKK